LLKLYKIDSRKDSNFKKMSKKLSSACFLKVHYDILNKYKKNNNFPFNTEV